MARIGLFQETFFTTTSEDQISIILKAVKGLCTMAHIITMHAISLFKGFLSLQLGFQAKNKTPSFLKRLAVLHFAPFASRLRRGIKLSTKDGKNQKLPFSLEILAKMQVSYGNVSIPGNYVFKQKTWENVFNCPRLTRVSQIRLYIFFQFFADKPIYFTRTCTYSYYSSFD